MTDPDLHLRVDDLLAADGAVGRRLPGYEERPEQRELATAIERALARERHLLAEAGTGVGKSFAYLLPAVLRAVGTPQHGPIVVSTRTIALQEQLEQKDLPFLHAVLPVEWSSVTAVGRNHYVCLRRMHQAWRERGALFDDLSHETDLLRVLDWSATSHDGLRFELDPPVAEPVWDEVKAEHGNCLHKACPHYDLCPYQRSRRRLESAQILVVNHALYVADVALRMAGARYLPDHRVAIFDEAHHLERVATEGLGHRLALGTVLWHLKRLHPRRARRSLLGEHGSPNALVLVEQVRLAAERFFARLDALVDGAPGGAVALAPGDPLEDPVSAPLLELAAEVGQLAAAKTEVDLKMELQARARGLSTVAAVLASLCGPTDGSTVRWIEREKRGAALRSAPLDVGDVLRQHVFRSPRTCVLLSATLGPSADREFGWLRERLGIDSERVDALRLGSPFDYRAHVRVTIADAMPDPTTQAAAWRRAVTHEVRDRVLHNGGRALVLCTAWSTVRELAGALRDALALEGIELLVQGEAPLRELLRRKRAEPTSVLLGTETFWEGIDVPGDALTLVIVTRLPFAQPDHPLTKARLQAIRDRGGDPFGEHSLPEAVLRFRQGFGRLIRSATDRGEVVVLDPRIRTKRYGRAFLDALPEGTVDG
ncbi:MAG: ATP-dependent DNA helicase [Planctomycetes bacterium]|nr:ATP-dependent DNA helicase [Planctomycetota bacterium]